MERNKQLFQAHLRAVKPTAGLAQSFLVLYNLEVEHQIYKGVFQHETKRLNRIVIHK